MKTQDEKIKELEIAIKEKVKQYVNAQKRYHGDSALSRRIEGEIDSLETQLRNIRKEV
jgi:hypothetical protein